MSCVKSLKHGTLSYFIGLVCEALIKNQQVVPWNFLMSHILIQKHFETITSRSSKATPKNNANFSLFNGLISLGIT